MTQALHHDQQHQVCGHVSQDTALIVKNYVLNKTPTPIRYWIETNPSYGQRVMKQMLNTRTGQWWNPKPESNYSQIVVMYHDPEAVYPQYNGTSTVNPIALTPFNLALIATEQLEAFKAYYRFDDVQHAIIAHHIQERLHPSGQHTPTEVPRASKVQRKPEANAELNALRVSKAASLAALAAGKAEEQRQKNELRALLIEEKRLKLLNAEPKNAPKPVTENETLTLEQIHQLEQDNDLVLLPPQVIYVRDPKGGPDIGTYDFVFEESQREQFHRLLRFCDDNDQYVPSNLMVFKRRAELLDVYVADYSFVSNKPKAVLAQQTKLTREQEQALIDELNTPIEKD